MHWKTCALAMGAILVSFAVSGVDDARACSICLPGDPIFSTQGTSAQQSGDFSVATQLRGWKKRSGALPEEAPVAGEPPPKERNLSQRLDIYLSWTPIDRLTLTVNLPFAFNSVTELEEDEQLTQKASGLGDVSIQASAILWRNRPVLPSTWVEGRFFLKAPTGASSQRIEGRRDPHVQLGSGSWDYGLGVATVHRLEQGALYASGTYRFNTEGSLTYDYGDVVLLTAGGQFPFGSKEGSGWLDLVTAGFALDLRWAAKDEFGGARYQDSGGTMIYATPSVRIRLPGFEAHAAPSFTSSVQVPLTQRFLFGDQEELPIWQVGLQYSF